MITRPDVQKPAYATAFLEDQKFKCCPVSQRLWGKGFTLFLSYVSEANKLEAAIHCILCRTSKGATRALSAAYYKRGNSIADSVGSNFLSRSGDIQQRMKYKHDYER